MPAAWERQTEWLAQLISENAGDLPVVILGKAFKPGTSLVDGSPSLLLAEILRERGIAFERVDEHVDGGGRSDLAGPACSSSPPATPSTRRRRS
jgi:hypothetical protein